MNSHFQFLLPAYSPPQQHPWHFRPYFRSYLISPSCNKTFPDNHLEKCSLRSKTLSKHWALHLRTVPSHSISIPSISVSNHCTTCTSRVIDWVGLLSFASSDVIVTSRCCDVLLCEKGEAGDPQGNAKSSCWSLKIIEMFILYYVYWLYYIIIYILSHFLPLISKFSN